MSRISKTFEQLAQQGRKALIPYVTAGDPHPSATLPVLRAMVEAGADMIELGVPFSDPMADGPVIQRSSERALKHGVGLADVLAMVAEFRRGDANTAGDSRTPVILMGYANPIEAMGTAAFVEAAAKAGVDGVIVVDYPPEECGEFVKLLRAKDMDLLFLLAPTSTQQRISTIARLASGYIYYVSLKGTTGAGHLDLADVRGNVARIRAESGLPVGVGFGIRDGATARAICEFADAAIIGSRVIQEMENAPPGEAPQRVRAFLQGVRTVMDQAKAA
ncbi:MAG TPA: tryptophan synthase subunit alpha [Burkholderiales bacterium]|nr:tryptophan synthase subunit alpha [Burkholderiales bacterium]